jgi:hypothetical protein
MVVWAVAKCVWWVGVSERLNWPWAARLHQLTVDTAPEGAATKLSDIAVFVKDEMLLYNIISPPGRHRFNVDSSGARRTSAPLWVAWGTYRL